MKVAIVKPDHLGDLILSLPAINAVAGHYPETTLFVSSSTYPLARHLLPHLEILRLDLPHLSKFSTSSTTLAVVTDLRSFDRVFFFRRDQVFTPAWTKLIARDAVLIEDSHEIHESKLQQDAVCASGIEYKRPDTFPGIRKKFGELRRVGLCLSAGFYGNRWPTMRWMELGRLLGAHGIDVSIICGPFERTEGETLVRLLGLDGRRHLIAGSTDFAAFREQVRELDLVVASDGGGAHLCSLEAPVLSLFGGSPYRRYAPFGVSNRVLTRLAYCSPCCQYHEHIVNGCVTIECLTRILPRSVFQAMLQPQGKPGERRDLGSGCTLFFGVSHS